MSNENNKHFDSSEMRHIQSLLQEIICIVRSKMEIPTDEEYETYANIPEEKKMIISKVLRFRNDEPALCSKAINWTEFYNSFADNLFLKSTILTLQSIIKEIEQTRIAHDLANYKKALEEFQHASNHKSADIRQTSKYDVLKLYI